MDGHGPSPRSTEHAREAELGMAARQSASSLERGETTTPLAFCVLFRTFSAFSTYREMKAHTGELAGLDPTDLGVSFSQPGSRRFTSVVGEFGGPPGGEGSAPCQKQSDHTAVGPCQSPRGPRDRPSFLMCWPRAKGSRPLIFVNLAALDFRVMCWPRAKGSRPFTFVNL